MDERIKPRERLTVIAEPAETVAPRPAKRDRGPPPRRRGVLGVVGAMIGFLFAIGLLGTVLAGAAGYAFYVHAAADLPDVDGLRSYQPRVMSRVYAGNAALISELATERRIFVPFTAIPDLVKQAFVSAEDQNFWVHRGVDPLAILRAAVTDAKEYGSGRRPVGASTITQQVAKNMLLDNAPTLTRKVREAVLALRIEKSLTKQRILELYLNEIYLGLQSYGVAAAAQAYFNKSLDALTLPEAAFLAALPKAPNNYNPFKFPDAARGRRDWVIERMAIDHGITAEQAALAKAQPVIPASYRRPEMVAGGDWFAEEVRRRLIERFGADQTTQGGLTIRTSLDPALQASADTALRDGLLAYDRKFGGWRGALGHLDTQQAGLRAAWPLRLASVARPAGLLPAWRLAVVTEVSAGEATVGWLEHQESGEGAPIVAVPHTGAVLLADLGWARPLTNGHLGAAPRRVAEVLTPGDLVAVEPTAVTVTVTVPTAAPTAATGVATGSAGLAAANGPAHVGSKPAAAPLRADRVVLRQIPLVQGALVSLDPTTGRVLALSGGWSFENSQFNRATQAERQPGSSFKPMVYLTALEQGISPSQQFLDAPIVIDQGAAGQWRPNNYGLTFSGPTSMHMALRNSLNLVTVRIAQQVGMEAVAKTATAFHVVDQMPRVLPAALGAVDTTVLRQAGAYAALSQGGREVVPTLIDSVQDRDGHVVWHADARGCDRCDDPSQIGPPAALNDTRKSIADPPSVFQIVTMMQDVVAHGTGYEAGKGLGRAIAGKTGTSQDFNDAWFVGFTPDLVTAVWIGYDTPSSLGENETGGAIAAPVWRSFMQIALKDRPNLKFVAPAGTTLATWDTGVGSVTDAFKPGQVPGASDPIAGADQSDGGDMSADGSGNGPDAAGGALTRGAPGGIDTKLGGLY